MRIRNTEYYSTGQCCGAGIFFSWIRIRISLLRIRIYYYADPDSGSKKCLNLRCFLYIINMTGIRIRIDPELLPGSGSGTMKIQSWIWIRNKSFRIHNTDY